MSLFPLSNHVTHSRLTLICFAVAKVPELVATITLDTDQLQVELQLEQERVATLQSQLVAARLAPFGTAQGWPTPPVVWPTLTVAQDMAHLRYHRQWLKARRHRR